MTEKMIPKRGLAVDVWERLRRNRYGMAGLIIIVMEETLYREDTIFTVSTLSPWMKPVHVRKRIWLI